MAVLREGGEVSLGPTQTLQIASNALPQSARAAADGRLVQLVRNALAHGIESTKQRVLLGKPSVGRLRAIFRGLGGGGIELIFDDDGAGIAFDAVRRRAVVLGRMNAEQAAVASEGELLRFLFESGFTTCEAFATEAGRGVGLDSVRSVAARMHAKINVGSAAGRGTSFRFTFPAGTVA